MKRVAGSVENKVVATELQVERDRLNFNTEELHNIYHPNEETRKMRKIVQADRDSDPNLRLTHKYYEMSRKEV